VFKCMICNTDKAQIYFFNNDTLMCDGCFTRMKNGEQLKKVEAPLLITGEEPGLKTLQNAKTVELTPAERIGKPGNKLLSWANGMKEAAEGLLIKYSGRYRDKLAREFDF